MGGGELVRLGIFESFFKGILIQTKEAQNATRKHIFLRSQRLLPSNTIAQLNISLEPFGLFEPRRYSFHFFKVKSHEKPIEKICKQNHPTNFYTGSFFCCTLLLRSPSSLWGSGRFWFFDLQQTTSHNMLELGGCMDEVHFLGWKSSQQCVVSIVMHKSDSISSQRIFVGRGFN